MQKGFIPVILLVVLVVTLSIGGYFWFKISSKPGSVSYDQYGMPLIFPSPNEQSEKPTPDTSTLDETTNPDLIEANWKTYIGSSSNRFSVSYPSSWQFIGKTDSGGILLSPVSNPKVNKSSYLILGPSGLTKSLEEVVNSAAGGGGGGKYTMMSRERITIDGRSAIRQDGKTEGSIDNEGKVIFTSEYFVDTGINTKNGDRIIFQAIIYNFESVWPSKYQSIFDKILSTFKFTN